MIENTWAERPGNRVTISSPRGGRGHVGKTPLGNADNRERKGVAGKAICKPMKTKGRFCRISASVFARMIPREVERAVGRIPEEAASEGGSRVTSGAAANEVGSRTHGER